MAAPDCKTCFAYEGSTCLHDAIKPTTTGVGVTTREDGEVVFSSVLRGNQITPEHLQACESGEHYRSKRDLLRQALEALVDHSFSPRRG